MATEDAVTGPMNLGNPREFTILRLAETVIEQTGSKSRIERRPLPSDDPRQRRPDISLAKRSLGEWEPLTPLEIGLTKTIAYFRDRGLRDS
jgi:UDP-glucuronate decarboxylase